VSRVLRLINARHSGAYALERWERDESEPGSWRSYAVDGKLTTREVLERADAALGVELVLTLPKPPTGKTKT
jgi:hypothetical protein